MLSTFSFSSCGSGWEHWLTDHNIVIFPFSLQANPSELYLDLGSKMHPKTTRVTKVDCKPELWCFEACLWWAERPDSETMNQGAAFISYLAIFQNITLRGAVGGKVEICLLLFWLALCWKKFDKEN